MGTRIVVSILTFTCIEQCTVSNVRVYTLVQGYNDGYGKIQSIRTNYHLLYCDFI